MNCSDLKLYMADFYDEELSQSKKIELGQHLGECENCRANSKKILAALTCIKKYYDSDDYFIIDGLEKNILKYIIAANSEEQIKNHKTVKNI